MENMKIGHKWATAIWLNWLPQSRCCHRHRRRRYCLASNQSNANYVTLYVFSLVKSIAGWCQWQLLQFTSFQSLNQFKQPLILLYVDAILSCSLLFLFSLALNFYFGYFFLLYNFLIYKKMALMDFKALSHWNNFLFFFSQFWFLRVDIACLQLYGYFCFKSILIPTHIHHLQYWRKREREREKNNTQITPSHTHQMLLGRTIRVIHRFMMIQSFFYFLL